MRLDQITQIDTPVPTLPLDCMAWLGQRELLRLCLEAVQSLDWNQTNLSEAPTSPYRPQMLMTLLSYCYARGIYASDDIISAAPTDWTILYICSRNIPTQRALTQFRRMHRESLVRCLSRVLQETVRLQFDQFRALAFDCPPHRLIRQARDSARHRVKAAAFCDSMAVD